MLADDYTATAGRSISNSNDSIRQSFESSWFSIKKEFSWDENFIKIVRFEKLIPNRGARMSAIAPKLLKKN